MNEVQQTWIVKPPEVTEGTLVDITLVQKEILANLEQEYITANYNARRTLSEVVEKGGYMNDQLAIGRLVNKIEDSVIAKIKLLIAKGELK